MKNDELYANTFNPSPMRYKSRFFAILFAITFVGVLCFFAYSAWDKWAIYELPKEKIVFSKLRPRSSVEFQDRFGKVLHYLYEDELLIYKPLNSISKNIRDYVVFLEDAKFWGHSGFDVAEIANSLEKNLEKGKVKRGASTITQQLAKNLFLGRERTWMRKFFEIPWTLRIEEDLSKSQILELYLNVIEWGPGLRGVEAASRHFFDKGSNELEDIEAMYLALIIPNPVRFDALANPKVLDFLNKKKSAMVHRLIDEKRMAAIERELYVELPFPLVAPKEHRRFALSHEAGYFGKRTQIPSSHYRKILEAQWKQFRKSSSGHVESTLDFELLEKIQSAPLENSQDLRDGYFVLLEEGIVRAFKKLPNGKKLPSEVESEICAENYSCEFRESIDWKSLAP